MSNLSTAGNCAISGSLTVGSTTALSAPLTSMSSGTFATGIITSTIAASNNITQNAGSISSGSDGMACNGTLSVLGTSEFESDATFDGNIKLNGNIVSNSLNISPIEISYLDGGTQNINTALTAVQAKTQNLTNLNPNIDKFAYSLDIGRNLNVEGTTRLIGGEVVIEGQTYLNGIVTLNSAIIANTKTITPIELSYLDGGTQNINTALTELQTKTKNLTNVSAFDDRFDKNLQIGGSLLVTGLMQMNGNGNQINGTTSYNANITVLGNLIASNKTITPTELSYLDGGTQNINTALTAQTTALTLKADTLNPTFSDNITVTNTITAKSISCAEAGNFVMGISTSPSAVSYLQGEFIYYGNGTFPTKSTGLTQGFSAYSETTTKATRFLNRAQGGVGGFAFYTGNSLNAPKLLGTLSDLGTLTLPANVNAVNSTFTGVTTTNSLNFPDGTGRKIAFHNSVNDYQYDGIATEYQTLRYNVGGDVASHVFTYGLNSSFKEMARINKTGLGLGTDNPTHKLHVLGNSYLDGDLTLNGEMSFRNGTIDGSLKLHPKKAFISLTRTENVNGLVATIVVPKHYGRKICLYTPINTSMKPFTLTPNTIFGQTINSITCSVKKNNVAFAAPSVTNHFTLPATNTFKADGGPTSSAVYYNGTTYIEFTPNDDVNQATYTVEFIFNATYVDSIQKSVFVNTNLPFGDSLHMCSRTAGIAPTYSNNDLIEEIIPIGGAITGSIETNDIVARDIISSGMITTNKFRAYGFAGACLVAADGREFQIYASIPDYGQFYRYGIGINTIVMGYRYTAGYHNMDLFYIIKPGYRLEVWDGTDYTLSKTLDYTNDTSVPQAIGPMSILPVENPIKRGSSCRLSFNGIIL